MTNSILFQILGKQYSNRLCYSYLAEQQSTLFQLSDRTAINFVSTAIWQNGSQNFQQKVATQQFTLLVQLSGRTELNNGLQHNNQLCHSYLAEQTDCC
jgi:hypothetical protein